MPFAPRLRLWPVADRSAGAHPLSPSGRSLLPDAAFRSPAAIPCLAARSRGYVAVPGLHLRSNPAACTEPVRLRAPAPAWPFLLPCGVRSLRRHPLPGSTTGLLVRHQAFAPLRDFSIPLDRSAPPDSGRRNLPYRLPDLPSLPVLAGLIN